MGVKPNYILFGECLGLKELWVVFEYFNKLVAFRLKLLLLFLYMPSDPFVLEVVDLFFFPKYCIVNVSWQISY